MANNQRLYNTDGMLSSTVTLFKHLSHSQINKQISLTSASLSDFPTLQSTTSKLLSSIAHSLSMHAPTTHLFILFCVYVFTVQVRRKIPHNETMRRPSPRCQLLHSNDQQLFQCNPHDEPQVTACRSQVNCNKVVPQCLAVSPFTDFFFPNV